MYRRTLRFSRTDPASHSRKPYRTDFTTDALRAVAVQFGTDDRPAGLCEPERVRATDAVAATAGTGDDRHLAVETKLVQGKAHRCLLATVATVMVVDAYTVTRHTPVRSLPRVRAPASQYRAAPRMPRRRRALRRAGARP